MEYVVGFVIILIFLVVGSLFVMKLYDFTVSTEESESQKVGYERKAIKVPEKSSSPSVVNNKGNLLKDCPYGCGREVATNAPTCPNCGGLLRTSPESAWLTTLAVLFVIFVFVWFVIGVS